MPIGFWVFSTMLILVYVVGEIENFVMDIRSRKR